MKTAIGILVALALVSFSALAQQPAFQDPLMDDERDGKLQPFARMKLTRKK